ncbi:MAG: DUF3179 domain-containing protein [Lewinellaceae bacterium]|nr:DUF3179 domain-containing protein [Lewinellaceae bacterium]
MKKLFTPHLYFLCSILLLFSCSKEESVRAIAGSGVSRPIVRVVNDIVNGQAVVVAGAEQYEFMVAYGREMPDGVLLEFSEIPTILPIVMEDQEGSRWDLFGYAVSGPRQGQRLPVVSAYIGYWFAIGGMYPGTEVFEGQGIAPPFNPPSASPGWTIPEGEVFSGSGFDLIPALDFPRVEKYREKDFWDSEYYLADTALLVGVKVGGKYRLYPHSILDFHEVVNDTIGENHFAVAYCPLTGTATAWNRDLGGLVATFGVSGFLYNSNLIAFDRLTESLWSQMRQECINGAVVGLQKDVIPVLETNWKTWKTLLREPELISFTTGHPYNYDSSPYSDYACSDQGSPYPVQLEDTRLPLKERVLAVIANGKAKAYRFSSFDY